MASERHSSVDFLQNSINGMGFPILKISAACMLNILSCLIVFLTNQLFVFCVKNDDFHDGSQV